VLYIYDKNSKQFGPSKETDFKSHGILERQAIERWVIQHPDVLGEELLIITTEYDKFDKTTERLDVLALDHDGKLVVIELKRDDSGKHVELQALKYAAYCSTLTMDQVVALRATYSKGTQTQDEVKASIRKFTEDSDLEELDDKPRIILAAKEFRPEVTASVLWLRKFGLDISCVKLTPYEIDADRLGLVSSVLIPLPEAEDYVIAAEQKEAVEGALTRTQEQYQAFFRDAIHALQDKVTVTLGEPLPRSRYKIPTGVARTHYEWAFHGTPRGSLGVELHFEHSSKGSNIAALQQLDKAIAELKMTLGEGVIVQEDWRTVRSRVYIEKDEGRLTDELRQWAVDTMVTFYQVFQPELEKLK
jgi:hypothetical protein